MAKPYTRFIMCVGMWIDTMWFMLLKLGLSTVILTDQGDGKLRLRSDPAVAAPSCV